MLRKGRQSPTSSGSTYLVGHAMQTNYGSILEDEPSSTIMLIHPAGPRRRKSHSPDSRNTPNLRASGRSIDPSIAFGTNHVPNANRYSLKRKKSSASASTSTGTAATTLSVFEDMHVDDAYERAKQFNAPSQSHPSSLISATLQSSSSTTSNRPHAQQRSRKDKGKAVDRPNSNSSTHSLSSRRHLTEEVALNKAHDFADRYVYSGPLAHAEFERMKKEIETLKRSVHESKKTIKKQAKKIEELKEDVNALTIAKNEHALQMQTVRAKHQKNEELIGTIETSLQCQICMDIILQPFALAPCGHILCLPCLQEWFRKAPPSNDDMDDFSVDPEDPDDPRYILTRSKSCPCCRAVVKRRPVPVFVVKAIASAIAKVKANKTAETRQTSPPLDDTMGDDPWKGIFPSDDSTDEDDYDDDDDDSGPQLGWGLYGGMMGNGGELFGYDTDSESGSEGEEEEEEDDDDDDDEEEEDEGDESGDAAAGEGVYVLAQWEPPSVEVDAHVYDFDVGVDDEALKMLRRGCTYEMIERFEMQYRHSQGLVAYVTSLDLDDLADDPYNQLGLTRNNRIFLGWNIDVDEADTDGELFMISVLADLRDYPERWQISDRVIGGGAMDVKRLLRRESVEEYATTDSEVWLDAEDLNL